MLLHEFIPISYSKVAWSLPASFVSSFQILSMKVVGFGGTDFTAATMPAAPSPADIKNDEALCWNLADCFETLDAILLLLTTLCTGLSREKAVAVRPEERIRTFKSLTILDWRKGIYHNSLMNLRLFDENSGHKRSQSNSNLGVLKFNLELNRRHVCVLKIENRKNRKSNRRIRNVRSEIHRKNTGNNWKLRPFYDNKIAKSQYIFRWSLLREGSFFRHAISLACRLIVVVIDSLTYGSRRSCNIIQQNLHQGPAIAILWDSINKNDFIIFLDHWLKFSSIA